MKKLVCTLLCIAMLLTLLVPVLSVSAQTAAPLAASDGQEFTVMSLNIRYSNSDDGTASLKWVVNGADTGDYVYRVDNAITEILKISPDIIGFQEYNFKGNSDVDTKLTEALTAAGYGIVMQTYTDGTQNQTPIFYKTAKFTAVTTAGAQGILQYSHGQAIQAVEGTQTLHVKVGTTSQATYTKRGTTASGLSVRELCDSTVLNQTGAYYPQTLTDEEIDAGNYVDLTNFDDGNVFSRKSITYNDDGSVTVTTKPLIGSSSSVTYKDGAYHTRKVLNAAPVASPSKSLTWGVLQHNTSGQRILMMSTHCALYLDGLAQGADDFTSSMAYEWNNKNAEQILSTVDEVHDRFGPLPTIVVGDFNMQNSHRSYAILSEVFDDSARLAPDAIYWEGTSLSMDANKTVIDESKNLYDVSAFREKLAPAPGNPIDHIFCSRGDLEVLSYNVLNDTPEQRVISDHYALVTTFVLPDVQTPACSHVDGVYRLEQRVVLTKGYAADTVYYTLDGSDPKTSQTRKEYTGALMLYGDVQLRAVSFRDGVYSLERTVNFATAAELMITEMIKNNQSTKIKLPNGTQTTTAGEVFAGFEVVNTSAHTVDLGRYFFWELSIANSNTALGDIAKLENFDYQNLKRRSFINELNKYVLQPGETAFIWLVNSYSYIFEQVYDASGSSGFAVDFVTESNYTSLGYPATAIGKVIHNTALAKAAFEYATGSTVTADLIVPIDTTAGAFSGHCPDGSGTVSTITDENVRFARKDYRKGANHVVRTLDNHIDNAGSAISRLFITYGYERTAENAFCSTIIANDGNAADGWTAGSAWAKQGSFHITNQADDATGKITGRATDFTSQKYAIGTLEDTEAALLSTLVHDLSMRRVVWSVNGVETEEWLLRNALPTFTGNTEKPSDETDTYVFTGFAPAPAACEQDPTGTYLVGTEVTYVAQYVATAFACEIIFLDTDGTSVFATMIGAIDGTITLPAGPVGERSFLGWMLEDGTFLNAGASYTVTNAVTFTPACISFSTMDGASVRTHKNSTGLRFLSSISRADYDRLAEMVSGGSISFGTYIVPQSYVDAAEGFDLSAFPKYLDVSATDFYREDDSFYYIAGSVANIRTQNYLLNYTACGYITLSFSDGTTQTVLAGREQSRGYNVYEVAYAAYNDRMLDASDTHSFEIDDPEFGVTYSPYSADQLRTIRSFLDPVVDLCIREGRICARNDSAYYTSPFSASSWEYDEARDRIVVIAESADAWSTVFACFIDTKAVAFSVNGSTLYLEYVIYSDFY